MSCDHLPWSSTRSTLRPMTLAPRAANWFSRAATAPSSVVQTGVKSLGWEKRTAQLSPIHSWKRMGPWVVSAVKSGATSLMRSDMSVLPLRCIYLGEKTAINSKPTSAGFCGWGLVRLILDLQFALGTHPHETALTAAGTHTGLSDKLHSF